MRADTIICLTQNTTLIKTNTYKVFVKIRQNIEKIQISKYGPVCALLSQKVMLRKIHSNIKKHKKKTFKKADSQDRRIESPKYP